MDNNIIKSVPNLSDIHYIGIGGISMSSIAAISKNFGYSISGSDRTYSALIKSLEDLGIKIYIGHKKENINPNRTPKDMVIVYTAAIANDNPELSEARSRGFKCMTRAEFLGQLMLGYNTRIGISGTHGKSTTTAMISAIYKAANNDATVLCGAEMKNYNSAYHIGKQNCIIFEACEYTDSFLSFYPTTAVVTNIELDHMDYFKSLEQYINSYKNYISLSNKAIVNFSDPNTAAAFGGYTKNIAGFALSDENYDKIPDSNLYLAENINYGENFVCFDISCGDIWTEKIKNIKLPFAGRHNIKNALAAAAAAAENGISQEAIKTGLESFCGISRRFETKGFLKGARIISDYAHHPTEIKATLSAAKRLGGKITAVFQPHSISRTNEFFDEFIQSFSEADHIIFADIYENLECDTGKSGITSASLAKATENSEYISDFTEIAREIKETASEGNIFVIMGAGDITKLFPLLEQEGMSVL